MDKTNVVGTGSRRAGRVALSEIARAAVCVPVRNEAETLPALLAALAAQDSGACDAVACFYLDGCTDGSDAILGQAAAWFPYRIRVARNPRPATANAGRARRAAMTMGLDELGARADALLLTTDADSRPSPGWLTAATHALAAADVAAGRMVRIEGVRDCVQTRIEHYYDRLHAYRRTVDPVAWEAGSGHHFVGGANLAFRACVYRDLGGFAPIPSGEDAALLDDAARAGFRVRRDGAMIVETSSRRHGRAPGGLAAALREIDRAGLPSVAHPAAAAWQYRAHAAARRAFGMLAEERMRARFGAMIGVSGEHVLGVGRDCPNAEAFAMRIVPAAPHGERPVPLAEAEECLATLERALCERAA